MNEREIDRIHHSLTTYAATAIPDDLDLWPALSAKLAAQQHHHSRDRRTEVSEWITSVRQPMFVRGGLALLLGAVLLAGGSTLLSRQPSIASAAGLLSSLATVTATQPAADAAASAGYRYSKSETLDLTMRETAGSGQPTMAALVPKTREVWIAPDGSGRIRETAGEPSFLNAKDRAAWEAAGRPVLGAPIDRDFGPGELWYEDFTRYPTDPAALAKLIRQRAEQTKVPVDVETFVLVGDLLREPGVPPALRSSLYRVAAQIPGVKLVGNVSDHAGRRGVAVAMTTTYRGGRERFVLIVDPATAALLGEEHVLLDRVSWLDADAAPPVVIGQEATYLDSGIVPTLPGNAPSPAPVPDKPQIVPSASTHG